MAFFKEFNRESTRIVSDSFSGNVGLSISQALMLTDMVQYGMRRLTDAMQQMTSVERIIQYTEIEPVS